jgi:hypothetical protein
MIINKLWGDYEKAKKATGIPPLELECPALDKFALFDELIASGRGQVRNGELYIFNANTKIIFIEDVC